MFSIKVQFIILPERVYLDSVEIKRWNKHFLSDEDILDIIRESYEIVYEKYGGVVNYDSFGEVFFDLSSYSNFEIGNSNVHDYTVYLDRI